MWLFEQFVQIDPDSCEDHHDLGARGEGVLHLEGEPAKLPESGASGCYLIDGDEDPAPWPQCSRQPNQIVPQAGSGPLTP